MLDIKPGVHVGQFRLGMSISETIQYLQHYIRQQNKLFSGFDSPSTPSSAMVSNEAKDGSSNKKNHHDTNEDHPHVIPSDYIMNKIEILYDGKNPLRNDIILKLVDDEIVLRFESKSQRLKFIEVNNVAKVSMSYSGTKFSGKMDEEATFVKIYQVFGPTYPGHFDANACIYYLSYPGITFAFPIPPIFSNLFGNDQKDNNQSMPMEFPNGTTPIATNVYVYNGYDFRSPNLPQDFDDDSYKSTIVRHVDVNIGKGIVVYNDLNPEGRFVNFNDTTQDVLMALGAPNYIYYKRHDKLRIHATKTKKNRQQNGEQETAIATTATESHLSITNNEEASRELTAVDYFYNYFTLGFDIMFNGKTHLVQKIILHTNFPGSKDFNIYVKCNFKLDATQFPHTKTKYVITADTKFAEIERILENELCSKPLVNDTTTASNPFGGTRFYAYNNCIFEVMKNGHINTAVLFA